MVHKNGAFAYMISSTCSEQRGKLGRPHTGHWLRWICCIFTLTFCAISYCFTGLFSICSVPQVPRLSLVDTTSVPRADTYKRGPTDRRGPRGRVG